MGEGSKRRKGLKRGNVVFSLKGGTGWSERLGATTCKEKSGCYNQAELNLVLRVRRWAPCEKGKGGKKGDREKSLCMDV